jgi:hypothetical protein
VITALDFAKGAEKWAIWDGDGVISSPLVNGSSTDTSATTTAAGEGQHRAPPSPRPTELSRVSPLCIGRYGEILLQTTKYRMLVVEIVQDGLPTIVDSERMVMTSNVTGKNQGSVTLTWRPP